eukprot:353939-Chlamydomonas_euryale.AAC.22
MLPTRRFVPERAHRGPAPERANRGPVPDAAMANAQTIDQLLEGDFDPDEWDKHMASAFDEDYYNAQVGWLGGGVGDGTVEFGRAIVEADAASMGAICALWGR